MKPLFIALIVMMLSLVIVSPALVQAEDVCPNHDTATIQALRDCVQHASTQPGITKSLLAKLDAAQAANNLGQPAVAVNILHAFAEEVQAQSGKYIDQGHAEHLLQHTQLVIGVLGG